VCFEAAQSEFYKQVYTKEENEKVEFFATLPTRKKPRDPVNGELTSRENADYLMPTFTQEKESDRALQETLRVEREARETLKKDKSDQFGTDLCRVEALRRRKEVVAFELAQMNKLLEQKRACMILGRVV